MTLYIHIPFCLKKCDYCDFFSIPPCENSKNEFIPNEYIEAVLNQTEFLVKHFSVQEFQSVYIGGGTPSLLNTTQIERLCSGIKKASPLAKNAEFTIEANPGDITREWLEAITGGGINRLSIGIQCANDTVLKAVGRRTTRSQIENAVQLIKTHWHGAWCADFIAGLPYQTKEMLKNDIDFVADNGATHISLYSLTVEEETPLAKRIANDETPYNADDADSLWLFGRDYLEQNSFMQYEISNFAKEGFQSRHNSAYWQLQDYLGAGAGAVGTVSRGSEQKQVSGDSNRQQATGFRFTNTQNIDEYVKFWKTNYPIEPATAHCDCSLPKNATPYSLESLAANTVEFEFLMMGFRTLRGVSATEYKRRFGGDLTERLGDTFEKWQKNGLACTYQKDGETFYALTREGILFLNKFLEEI